MDLQGKKILFIGIGFYDYEDAIAYNIKRRGAIVSYVNTCTYNFLIRCFRWLGKTKATNVRTQKIRTQDILNTPIDNDIIFVIKGENLTQLDINLLKERNPNAQFILYLWDSLVRQDNTQLLLRSFDIIWSFDRKDCEENPSLKFRPLFYRTLSPKQDKLYDLSFIGWIHSDRLAILRSLKVQLIDAGKPYYLKLYTGPYRYFWDRYITKKLSSNDRDLIITKPVDYREFQRVISSSRAILDLAHPLQSGLTMRTIETLAAGCHLLTTNSDISQYPDITKGSYTLFDRANPNLPNLTLNDLPNISTNYSLDSFVNQIFE